MCAEMLRSFLERIARYTRFNGRLEALKHGSDAAKIFVDVFEFLDILALLVEIDYLFELLAIKLVRTLLRPMLITHL